MPDHLFADTYLAGLYDAWCPRQGRCDYDFYLPRILSAGAVLDAGCGTGTLLHEARQRGHVGRLCGLDPAEGMLKHARRRNDIEWVLGDLAAARFTGEFDLIVMTGHAFQAIVANEDIRHSLASVRRALVTSGRFAFETRNPVARAWERWRPDNAAVVTDPDGFPVRITTEIVAPFDGRTVSFAHAFTGDHAGLPQVSRSTLRFLGLDMVSGFLREAGLEIEHVFGDFDGSILSDESPEIIVIARAP
jgi:SAM-dependent methyltransferase